MNNRKLKTKVASLNYTLEKLVELIDLIDLTTLERHVIDARIDSLKYEINSMKPDLDEEASSLSSEEG